MSGLAWANASWRSLLSKLETRAKENTSLGELSLISPLCSRILTPRSDSSIWWQSFCQRLITTNRSQTQGLPRICCRIDQTGFISIFFGYCCYYYWAVSLISTEDTQVCTETQSLPEAIHLPGAGACLGLTEQGHGLLEEILGKHWWISLGGSPSPAAPHKSEYSRMGNISTFQAFQFLIDVPAWLSLHSRQLLSHGVTFRLQNCPGTVTNLCETNSTRQLSPDGSSGPMFLVTGRSTPNHRFSSTERCN